MQAAAIILWCVAAAIAYGVAHDLVTAHLCVEYFTIGHPPVFGTEDPVLLALGWGVIATWWMGLLLGVPLALAARAGSRPRRSAAQLVRGIAKVLGAMAVGALVAGVLGFALARGGRVVLLEPMASRVPAERHVAFVTCLWMHLASYGTAAVGGLALAVATFRSRSRSRGVT